MTRRTITISLFWVLSGLCCLSGCYITNDAEPSAQCVEGETRDGPCGNTCICDGDGQWGCTALACDECQPGDTMPAGDGCNSCSCHEGQWQCTQIGCPEPCEPGDTRDADDGCNTCTCEEDGSWACTERACAGPACGEEVACEAFYINCNCAWSCLPAGTEIVNDDCDVDCGAVEEEPPECGCINGECNEVNPQPGCEPGSGFEAENGQSCQCDESGVWSCLCPEDEGEGDCICEANGEWNCNGPADRCDEIACEPFYDTCQCDWTCVPSDDDRVSCDQECPADNRPVPECGCADGQCEVIACEPGEQREATDGCNTCECVGGGGWACTEIGCEPPECDPGVSFQADNGQSCECNADGRWECACPMEAPPGNCICQNGDWECRDDPQPEGNCNADADCVVSGCSSELCGPEPLASDCAFLPEYACFQNAEITHCGCHEGRCGWAQTPALAECIENAGGE